MYFPTSRKLAPQEGGTFWPGATCSGWQQHLSQASSSPPPSIWATREPSLGGRETLRRQTGHSAKSGSPSAALAPARPSRVSRQFFVLAGPLNTHKGRNPTGSATYTAQSPYLESHVRGRVPGPKNKVGNLLKTFIPHCTGSWETTNNLEAGFYPTKILLLGTCSDSHNFLLS